MTYKFSWKRMGAIVLLLVAWEALAIVGSDMPSPISHCMLFAAGALFAVQIHLCYVAGEERAITIKQIEDAQRAQNRWEKK